MSLMYCKKDVKYHDQFEFVPFAIGTTICYNSHDLSL